ncbi:MAG: HAMP domain-containing sensor histidine kinase [Gemmatimonadota bacterium]
MSLRRRFVFALAGFALLLAVAGGWFSWSVTSRALERELDEKLVWVAGAAAEVGLQGNFILQLRPNDEASRLYTAPREQLLGLLRYVDKAHVFRRDNTLLVTTDSPEEFPIGISLRWLDAYTVELDEAWSTGEAVTPVFRGEDDRYYKYGFKRLGETEAMLAVLMQANFLQPLVQFRNTLIAGSAAAVALSILLAMVLAGNIVQPLERLSRAALRIQRGRWEESVANERGDELGRLARAMERMRVGVVHRDEQLRLMLAQVAHEIRNPLGGLELFASAALETEDREERLRLLGRVRREVEALNEIINSFLTFARPLDPVIQLHDVRGPLREAAELIELQVSSDGGTLTVDLPDEPLLVRADADHVKRVALNLLKNAAQAGRDVWMRGWWQNGEAVVSIADDGPGVSPALRERIFEPFVTDQEQGAGLGLAIVKRVLETNGARVELVDPAAERDPEDRVPPVGKGAEFRVYFQGSEDLPG